MSLQIHKCFRRKKPTLTIANGVVASRRACAANLKHLEDEYGAPVTILSTVRESGMEGKLNSEYKDSARDNTFLHCNFSKVRLRLHDHRQLSSREDLPQKLRITGLCGTVTGTTQPSSRRSFPEPVFDGQRHRSRARNHGDCGWRYKERTARDPACQLSRLL